MHDDDVVKVEEMYNKMYSGQYPSLIGKGLSQFHSDFKLDGATGEPVSVGAIILGKKSYYHELVDSLNKDCVGHKLSLKGVTESAIMLEAKRRGGSIKKVYEDLYTGYPVMFDLNAGGKVRFSSGSRKCPLLNITKESCPVRWLLFRNNTLSNVAIGKYTKEMYGLKLEDVPKPIREKLGYKSPSKNKMIDIVSDDECYC
jgi:hypothetical protein